MLLTILISMHCLSDKRSVERSFVLTGVINGGDGVREKQAENLGDFSCDCFSPIRKIFICWKEWKEENICFPLLRFERRYFCRFDEKKRSKFAMMR